MLAKTWKCEIVNGRFYFRQFHLENCYNTFAIVAQRALALDDPHEVILDCME